MWTKGLKYSTNESINLISHQCYLLSVENKTIENNHEIYTAQQTLRITESLRYSLINVFTICSYNMSCLRCYACTIVNAIIYTQ